MGYVEKSKHQLRKERDRKKREEKRWKRRSGKIKVRFVCPLCGGPHHRDDHDHSIGADLDAGLDRALDHD